MRTWNVLAGLLMASQIYAAESALPAWLANEPGLSAPLVCKPYLEKPDPEFKKLMRKNPNYAQMLSKSSSLLYTPIPELTEKSLERYYKTWTRRFYYVPVYYRLTNRFRDFTQGYLLTGDVKYVRGTEEAIREYCKLNSWALPRPGERRGVINGIDLISTDGVRHLALALAVMKSEMDPALYAEAREKIIQRVIEPSEVALSRPYPTHHFSTKGNWNAVCNANLISTAACILWDEPERLAKFVDGCLRSINYSLKPFAADGYCSEGPSYWNYGVGHYLDAALIVYVMTDGKQNLLDQPTAQNVLFYPYKIRMSEKMVPAFADSSNTSVPGGVELQKIDFLLGKKSKQEVITGGKDYAQRYVVYYLANPTAPKNITVDPGMERVSTFPVSGVAVCRPADSSATISAAWKGGNNHENHNHNDVGSFVIGIGDVPVLCDPENPDYTPDSFSAKRYENPYMGSFGHSVPLVDGKPQVEGTQTDSKLLKETRTSDFFSWEIDILPAYRVKGVKELIRTFSFDWTGAGTFTVSDRVKAEQPISFETALTSPGKFKEIAPGVLEVTCSGKTLTVKIDTGNVPYELYETVMKGHEIKRVKTLPTRLGIRLKDKVMDARITLTITEKTENK